MRELFQRLRHMIGIGLISRLDDTGAQQKAQLQIGKGAGDLEQLIDGLNRLGEYGFASNPPVGSEAVALFVAGNRSSGVIIATGDRATRLAGLLAGEAALYNGVEQTFLKMATDGKAYLNCDLVVTGNISASKDITDQTGTGNAKTVKNLRDGYDSHKHPGVQAGGSSTGTTDTPV